LFGEGRALLKQGQLQAACEHFERSRRLNTTVAVLLNLGLCHRQAGRTATAHGYYRRAEVLATLQGDDRRELAHDEAAKLAAQRASLVLRMTSPPGPDARVSLDGQTLQPESWTQPMFLDAGEHTLRVESDGKVAWEQNVAVQDGGQHVLLIPALDGKSTKALALAAPVKVEDSVLYEARPAPSQPHDLTRIAAVSSAGLGVVGIGAGLVLGWVAQSAFSDSHQYCTADDRCKPLGVELRDDAHANATRATVVSIAGAVALTTGIVLWLVSPPPERRPAAATAALVRDGRQVPPL
jgi:hypothetical protein